MGFAVDVDEPARVEDVADLAVPDPEPDLLVIHHGPCSDHADKTVPVRRVLPDTDLETGLADRLLAAVAHHEPEGAVHIDDPAGLDVRDGRRHRARLECRLELLLRCTYELLGKALSGDVYADTEDEGDPPILPKHGLSLPLHKDRRPVPGENPILVHYRLPGRDHGIHGPAEGIMVVLRDEQGGIVLSGHLLKCIPQGIQHGLVHEDHLAFRVDGVVEGRRCLDDGGAEVALPLELPGCLDPGCDVPGRAPDARRGAVPVEDQRVAVLHDPFVTVLGHDGHEPFVVSLLHDPPDIFTCQRPEPLRYDVPDVQVQEVGFGIAGAHLCCQVGLDDAAVEVMGVEEVGYVLEDIPVLLFALPEGPLGVLPLGDVTHRFDGPHDLSVPAVYRACLAPEVHTHVGDLRLGIEGSVFSPDG